MTTVNVLNPYKPGSGLYPPYLAGRRRQISQIVRSLNLIKDATGEMKCSPFSNMVITGPHGVGKTALLKHAINEADKRGIYSAQIDSTLLSGPSDKLVNHMFPDKMMKKTFGLLSSFRLGFKDYHNLWSAMPAFLSKKPLLLILDDAHTCDLESLGGLCEDVQNCMSSCLPLSCIFAGPMGVRTHVRDSATYMERADFMEFNTLSQDEAREALEIPAREAGRPLDPDSLEILLDWAANYPYFIQLAGKHAWDASVEGDQGERISVEDARKGLAEADKHREDFYAGIFRELEEKNLVVYTAQLVKMIRKNKDKGTRVFGISDRLKEINPGMDHSTSCDTVKKLLLTGLFWKYDAQVHSGIPSMFDYIERRMGT